MGELRTIELVRFRQAHGGAGGDHKHHRFAAARDLAVVEADAQDGIRPDGMGLAAQLLQYGLAGIFQRVLVELRPPNTSRQALKMSVRRPMPTANSAVTMSSRSAI